MKEFLRISGNVDLVADVSNVCRASELGALKGAPSWQALERVLAAWVVQFGRPRAVLVCDRSLLVSDRPLTGTDLLRFREVKSWGARAKPPVVLDDLPCADEQLLALAEKTGASVLSKDRYLDHRRKHQWIQGATERFFEWTVEPETGAVEIVPRAMRITGAYTMSQAEQAREAKKRRLTESLFNEVLRWHFRCTREGCEVRDRSPDRLISLPRTRNGILVCPGCRGVVERTVARKRSRVVKVEAGGRALRFALEESESVVLGRAEAPVALGELLDRDDRARVSSRHLRLAFDGTELSVTDLGSTNGTCLQRWSARQGAFSDVAPLVPKQAIVLRSRERLTIAGVLTVALSGRRGQFGKQTNFAVSSARDDVSETVFLDGLGHEGLA